MKFIQVNDMTLEEESYVCLNKIKYLYKKVQGKGFEPQFTGTTMIDN